MINALKAIFLLWNHESYWQGNFFLWRCDRILWYGRGLHQISYVRGESRFSDHRPVCSIFIAEVESINRCKFKKTTSCSSRIEVEELLPYLHGYWQWQWQWQYCVWRALDWEQNCNFFAPTGSQSLFCAKDMNAPTDLQLFFQEHNTKTNISKGIKSDALAESMKVAWLCGQTFVLICGYDRLLTYLPW